jgi:SEC-C motif
MLHHISFGVRDLKLSGAFCDAALAALGHRREFAESAHADSSFEEYPEPYVRAEPKVGRNDPCPCGTGKKYKKCCGAQDSPSTH